MVHAQDSSVLSWPLALSTDVMQENAAGVIFAHDIQLHISDIDRVSAIYRDVTNSAEHVTTITLEFTDAKLFNEHCSVC